MNVSQLKAMAKTPTARLASSYLAIIMLMSIGFSIVFYNASWHELGRPAPPPGELGIRREYRAAADPRLTEFFEDRAAHSRQVLFGRLVTVNLVALIIGGFVSYSLARRTLEPIEANMEAQNQFVSDASHELRTPLTALQTTNEVALRKSKLSAVDTKDILTHNVAEVVKLQQLTDSLLKLAKADAGAQPLSPTPLPELVSDALNVIMPQALKKHIVVEDTIPKVLIQADRAGLTQALVTVLDNAIKYSPPKSVVHVQAAKHGRSVFLTVADNGPGISSQDLPHIFDRFYRADASRNKQQADGFGIGLSFAKKIVKQHHGELTATSTADGTTITFKLPLS